MGIIKVLLIQCEKLPGGNTPGEGWGLCLYCHALLCVLPAKVTLRAKTNLLVHFMPATLPKYPQDAVWTLEKWFFQLILGSQIEIHFHFMVGVNTLPTVLCFQLEMNQVAMYSLMFAREKVAGFVVYPFRSVRGQEVKVSEQMYITYWVHI